MSDDAHSDDSTQPLSGWRPRDPAEDGSAEDLPAAAQRVPEQPVAEQPAPEQPVHGPSPIPAQDPAWGALPVGPPPPTRPLPHAAWPPAGPPRPWPLAAAPGAAAAPAPRRALPGWTWPAVAALALLVGLFGGALGAVGVDQLREAVEGTATEGGLEDQTLREAAPLEVDNGSLPAVAQALLPSTVQILAAYEGDDEGATGSGFVLDGEGHVVTNNHVVASAAQDSGPITVIDHRGRRHRAEVVGRSPVYDLAVLRVRDAAGLEPAALGASRALRVGEAVVAFGSPLGLSQTVTAGIVSALNRPVTTGDSDNESSYINAVQTDAAINPGNSGGPLVNLRGQVVGVNSAIATTGAGLGGEAGNIGVGFAIPIEQVRTTVDQILRTGEAQYPVIGAQVRTGGGDGTGAQITEVMSDTPAERAGLRKGDVVTAVGGQPVTDGIALIVAIRTHQPGDTVEFTVRREGRDRTLSVTLAGEVG